MDEYSVENRNRALVRRNRTKIDLCGPKSVHDPGEIISYFVILNFLDFVPDDLWISNTSFWLTTRSYYVDK